MESDSKAARRMSLTLELVALCHRDVIDPGPEAKYDYFVDADYAKAVERLLQERPTGPFWLFAYGSLIWKPEFPTEESLLGVADGWHRAFCIHLERYRGSPEQPGLMMALDRGGRCEGVLLRLSEQDLASQLDLLLQREIGSHEALESVRWIDVQSAQGPVRALVFYAHPAHLDYYVNSLPLEQVARILARACGHWGSGAQYLHQTVSKLEEFGIHDENLWMLQELVAEEIQGREFAAGS
ncbi:MAG: gamma-glutamylcyclotransferase [Aestuariivirga sp.]|nr:gamma-glutamylcyclotransferase [Aestuariivirga sp.]